jgi:hypothetical protein
VVEATTACLAWYVFPFAVRTPTARPFSTKICST